MVQFFLTLLRQHKYYVWFTFDVKDQIKFFIVINKLSIIFPFLCLEIIQLPKLHYLIILLFNNFLITSLKFTAKPIKIF